MILKEIKDLVAEFPELELRHDKAALAWICYISQPLNQGCGKLLLFQYRSQYQYSSCFINVDLTQTRDDMIFGLSYSEEFRNIKKLRNNIIRILNFIKHAKLLVKQLKAIEKENRIEEDFN